MQKEKEEKKRSYKILVYGIEKRNLTALSDTIETRNFSISFEPFNTNRRFNEYDGVILFQGIFESGRWETHCINPYYSHSCDRDELDKRKKEARLLTEAGGFLCFLLNEPFIDTIDDKNFGESDLAKYHLNCPDFYRVNFDPRVTDLDIKSDEFKTFLNNYGAASSHFYHFNQYIEWRVLASAANKVAGMIINRNNYFLPTLIPDNRPEIIEEYFTSLTKSLTSSYNKLQVILPEWIEEFSFDEENKLSAELEKLQSRILEIKQRNISLRKYKSILALTGDDLVTNTIKIFTDGFGINVDPVDEFREDFKLLDNNSKPICLCEIKGTNTGVRRTYVSQVDSNRDRSNFKPDFPSLLIINTHIKNARTLNEKDKEIAEEQISHAVRNNILIIRTIDLLELLKICLAGKLTREEVVEILTKNNGWLRVSANGRKIIDGND